METTAMMPARTDRTEAFQEKLLGAVQGTFTTFSIYLGDRLGYYRVLDDDGALTSRELAERTGTDERYAREWLEQQTVAGVLEVEDASADPRARRFRLPPGHDVVLADRESVDFMSPLAQLVVGSVSRMEALVEAYRSGGGVAYEDYGRDLREGQGRMNRVAFLELLGKEWLPAVADVDRRLRSAPPARIADFGCGVGWSAIGMAKSYPSVRVDGFDLDAASIEEARLNAREAGVDDRVRFQVRDASEPELARQYDLVTAFECLHDMSSPVPALRAMRRLLNDGGSVLVVDERAGEQFTPEGNDVEPLLYGFSIVHCLPAGRACERSAATGTVLRPATLEAYAREAGFERVEVLPIENFFFRFYRLT